MMAGRIRRVALLLGKDLARRRSALGMLVVLPLAFYLSSLAGEGAFVLRIGGIGVAWSLTGAGLFLALGSRALAPRLVLAGYRPHEILSGQMLLLATLALPLVALFGAVVLLTEPPTAPGQFAVAVCLTALVAIPLGLLLGSAAPSELEGTLLLVGLLGVQMSLPLDATAAPFLPLYGPLRLIEHAAGNDVSTDGAIAHALGATIVLTFGAFALWARRTRVFRWSGHA